MGIVCPSHISRLCRTSPLPAHPKCGSSFPRAGAVSLRLRHKTARPDIVGADQPQPVDALFVGQVRCTWRSSVHAAPAWINLSKWERGLAVGPPRFPNRHGRAWSRPSTFFLAEMLLRRGVRHKAGHDSRGYRCACPIDRSIKAVRSLQGNDADDLAR